MNTIKLNEEKSVNDGFYYNIDVYGIRCDVFKTKEKIINEEEYLLNIINSVDEILTNNWEEGAYKRFHHLFINDYDTEFIEIELDYINVGHFYGRDYQYHAGMDVANILMGNVIEDYCRENEGDFWVMTPDKTFSRDPEQVVCYRALVHKDVKIGFYDYYCNAIKGIIGKENFKDLIKKDTDVISFI